MKELIHRMDLSARLHIGMGNTYLAEYIELQRNSLEKICEGSPYTASTFYIPGEIYSLFDMEAIYIERLAGFAAANKLLPNIQFYCSINRLPECACSYQIAFDSFLRNNKIPYPNEIVALSYACDDGWMYGCYASDKYEIPFHFIDSTRDEKALGEQLRALHSRLRTRYKEINSIEDIVEISNRTMASKEEIDRLRFENPGIMDSMDAFRMFTSYNDLGNYKILDILNNLKDSIYQRLKTYRYPSGPKILWLGVIPLYHNRIVADLEKRYGCKVVYEELFDFTSSYLSVSSFFDDLARRIQSTVFFTLQNRLEAIEGYCRAIGIDGILHFSQRNCKFLPSMVPILRREMEKKKVPFVEVSGDVIEPQCFEIDRFWNVMDVFFEGIYGGKKVGNNNKGY